MIRRLRERADEDDRGISLIELIVYIALSAVVATLVTSMLISSLKGQDQVTSVTQATTRGQTIAQAIERALRNATSVVISPDSKTLTVQTTLGEECQGFRLTSGKQLQAALGAGFHSWKPLADDVAAISGHVAFGWDDGAVTYSLSFATDGSPVELRGSVVPRGTGGDVGAACS